MGNSPQHAMFHHGNLPHMQTIKSTPKYTTQLTSYPGPYAVYENCPGGHLSNVHDPNITSNYFNTSGHCAFGKLSEAKAFCNADRNCTGVSGVISSDDLYLPVTGGIPTLGGVTMNGTANVFYHKIG